MKSPRPLFPIFVAAFPVVTVFSLNMAMVPLGDLWRPLAFSILGALALWVVFGLLFRSVAKGAIMSALLVTLVFSYGPLTKYLDAVALQVTDVVVILAGIISLKIAKRNFGMAVRALNFGSTLLVVLPLVHVIERRPSGRHEASLQPKLAVKAVASKSLATPDIFFIILDGYGREDQLERVMSYSNAPFVAALRSRGFYVADKSHSNYVQTQLSLTATLNLSFLQDFPDTFRPNSDDRRALKEGMDKSFVASYLGALGYQYIAVTSGFDEVAFPSATLKYDRPLALTMLEDTLVGQTPLSLAPGPITSRYDDRRKSLTGAFDNLKALAQRTTRPRFIVAHVIAPHPPFVFDAEGRPIMSKKIPFGFWDGSHFIKYGGSPQEYRDGYVGQVQYLNRQVLSIIDTCLANPSGASPVVIIEGDHGSKLGLDQEDPKKTDFRECFANLMAFHVPDSVRTRLYPTMTSGNTFRVLFDGLFGETLPMLPDRSFYSPFSAPYQFTEVTKGLADESSDSLLGKSR